jgi:hypothetical protein
MPNPSTITADLLDQFEAAVERSQDLRFGKETREINLRRARELAAELGIEGPPPINGRPAQPEVQQRKPRMVIVLDGGLVQNILANFDVEVISIDYDIDGADEEDLTPVPQGDGSVSDAYVSAHGVEFKTNRVDDLFALIK